jgi:hypothetical protein
VGFEQYGVVGSVGVVVANIVIINKAISISNVYQD